MRHAIILSINIQAFAQHSRFSAEYKLFSGASNFFQASKCKFPFCVLHFLLSSQAHAAARRAVENRRICIREFADRRIRGNSGGFGTRTVSEAALHDIPLLGSAFLCAFRRCVSTERFPLNAEKFLYRRRHSRKERDLAGKIQRALSVAADKACAGLL